MWSLWVIPPYCVSRAVGETDLFRPMGLACLGLAPNFWPFARALRMGGTAPALRPSVPRAVRCLAHQPVETAETIRVSIVPRPWSHDKPISDIALTICDLTQLS